MMRQADALWVTVIHSLAELQSIAQDWAALFLKDSRATPFQSPEWLIPWAKCFGANRLLSIAVHRGRSLVALVPLYIHTDDVKGRQRQLLLLGVGTSDYLDCIAAPECGSHALELIGRELVSRDCWDVAHLQQLQSGSPLLRLARHNPRIAISTSEPCFRVLLDTGHSLPAKLKGGIGYYRRRAEAMGQLCFVQATSPSLAAEFFESLVVLHGKRWMRVGGPGVLSDPCVLAHHREAIPLLQASDSLRMYALHLGGKVIGVIYALADKPRQEKRSFYYYLSGFDPEFHFLSPGTLLVAGLVDEARREGAIAVDFLRGQERYKQLWGAEPVETYALGVKSSRSVLPEPGLPRLSMLAA
jgi:CelD/BcsL family acetyltransferase involved in cellulose biosynthesis